MLSASCTRRWAACPAQSCRCATRRIAQRSLPPGRPSSLGIRSIQPSASRSFNPLVDTADDAPVAHGTKMRSGAGPSRAARRFRSWPSSCPRSCRGCSPCCGCTSRTPAPPSGTARMRRHTSRGRAARRCRRRAVAQFYAGGALCGTKMTLRWPTLAHRPARAAAAIAGAGGGDDLRCRPVPGRRRWRLPDP